MKIKLENNINEEIAPVAQESASVVSNPQTQVETTIGQAKKQYNTTISERVVKMLGRLFSEKKEGPSWISKLKNSIYDKSVKFRDEGLDHEKITKPVAKKFNQFVNWSYKFTTGFEIPGYSKQQEEEKNKMTMERKDLQNIAEEANTSKTEVSINAANEGIAKNIGKVMEFGDKSILFAGERNKQLRDAKNLAMNKHLLETAKIKLARMEQAGNSIGAKKQTIKIASLEKKMKQKGQIIEMQNNIAEKSLVA